MFRGYYNIDFPIYIAVENVETQKADRKWPQPHVEG